MRALTEAGVWTPTEDERTEAAEAVADYCYAYARRTVAHSREILARLRPHYDMVLVSNFYGNINAILKDFDLPFFLARSGVGRGRYVRKPDPAIYRLGVEATGARPVRCSSWATRTTKTSYGPCRRLRHSVAER